MSVLKKAASNTGRWQGSQAGGLFLAFLIKKIFRNKEVAK